MREFVIGREGEQAFPIPAKHDKVSRRHARITIGDDGQWRIEDLQSSNGTYVQRPDGRFERIASCRIDEFTRVALGDMSVSGYQFLAHHVLEPYSKDKTQDAANYQAEFQHVLELNNQLLAEKEAIEAKRSKQMMMRNIPTLVSALVGLIIFAIFPEQRLNVVVCMAPITAVVGFVMNMQSIKDTSLKDLAFKTQKLRVCPKCGLPLSDPEMERQACMKCGAHA